MRHCIPFILILVFLCVPQLVGDSHGDAPYFPIDLEVQQEFAQEAAQEIVASLVFSGMTDFEKVMVLHEYITNHLTYGFLGPYTTSYTALVHHQADCVGHARGLALLFETAGLESEVVVRRAGHLWVKVKLGNHHYNVDPTWCNVNSNWRQFSWFLLSDEQNVDQDKGVDHILQDPGRYPPASEPFQFQEEDYIHRTELRRSDVLRVLGNLSLPPGHRAPRGGIMAQVNGTRVMIPQGESSAFFMVTLDRGDPDSAYLRYNLKEGRGLENYAREALWNGRETQIGRHNGELLDVTGEDLSGMVLFILSRQRVLSGTLSLPRGRRAEAGSYVSMELTAHREDGQRVRYYDWIYLEEGEASVDFSIDVPWEDQHLDFYLYYYSGSLESQGYQRVGYYADRRTTSDSSRKGFFSLEEDLNLSMEVVFER